MQKLQTNDTDAKKQRHIYHKYMNITVTNNKYRTNKKTAAKYVFFGNNLITGKLGISADRGDPA